MSTSASRSSRDSSQGVCSHSSLLAQVAGREPRAWERFSELYGPLVYHWCRKCGLQAQDAADVTQEVFFSVARGVTGFLDNNTRRFRPWLWTITRNQIRDFARRRKLQVRGQGGSTAQAQFAELPEPEAEEPTDAPAERALFARAIQLVRGEFTDQTWEAFWRATVDEHPTAEIAAELGISANAVRQYKSRVLRRLRQELG